MKEIVEAYEKGVITADHLAVMCLQKIDPKDPSVVLTHLSPELLARTLNYTNLFLRGNMRSNYGSMPAPDQVAAAKQWIEANGVNGDGGDVANAKAACDGRLDELHFTEAEIK